MKNKMCINCKGIKAILNEDYCTECIIDIEKIKKDKCNNNIYYRYCLQCRTWYNIENGHYCNCTY